MRALCVLLLVLAACKDTPPKQTPTVTAAPGDAAPAIDATSGPVLDLVSCAPAPLLPGDRPTSIGTGRRPGRGGGGVGGLGMGVGRLDHMGGRVGGTAATVLLGATKEGGVKGAAAVLTKHANRLRYCYEQNLPRVPTLAGSSTLSIILNETGSPHEVIVEDSIDNELSLCLKHIVMELQFPKPAKAPATIVQLVTFAWSPITKPDAPEPALWTPYAASHSLVPSEVGVIAAVGLKKVMPTAKLATCLGPQHTGSVRAIARIGVDGSVIEARFGGFGDRVAEACMAAALVGVKADPSALVAEVACDFVRGDPAPWRIAADAGYRVLDAVPRHADPSPLVQDAAASAKETFLVLISRASDRERLRSALAVASQGAGYIVALEEREGGPHEFLTAGRGPGVIPDPAAPMTLDTREPLIICGGLLTEPASAPLADVDKLFATAARRCTRKPCPTLLTISLQERIAELPAVIDAARRAGFARIRLGDGACPR